MYPKNLLSKYVAGREKDLRFSKAAAAQRLAHRDVLMTRLATMVLDPRVKDAVAARIAADFVAR